MQTTTNSTPLQSHSTELDRQILETLEQAATVIGRATNRTIRAHSKDAIQKLAETPQEVKLQILKRYQDLLSWDEAHRMPFSERALVNRALSKMGMSIHDDFWKLYSENDMIEIYSADMIQVYRSFNFFEISGYSLLDLSVFEWFVLWERSQSIITKLQDYAILTLKGQIGVNRLEIPKHLLREKHRSAMTEPFISTASIAEFKFSGPVQWVAGEGIAGFVVTSRGQLIDEKDSAQTISFI